MLRSHSPPFLLAAAFAVASTGAAAITLASSDGNLITTEGDLATALQKLTEDEMKTYLSSAQRIANLAERITLARATKSRANQLTSSEQIALELERDLAGYGFMKRVWVDNETKRTVSAETVRKRASELYSHGHESCQAPEKFNASHILVRMDNKLFGEATALAEKAGARLKAGESFEAVAKSVSEDDSSAKDGGKLPSFTRQEVDTLFARNVIGKREIGKVSGPFLTPFGIHFGRLNAVLPPARMSADECMPALLRIAELELRQNVVIDVEKALYESTKLDVKVDAIADLAKKNTPEKLSLTPELIRRIEAMAAEQRNADLKPAQPAEPKK
ncbi:MAG: hypothetical protein EAZ30_03310 [Betaproteobacteria bacterium]|nr:MAG: hypothetical protein EAZ30_03310 [Betaproteobacteria bacterium]